MAFHDLTTFGRLRRGAIFVLHSFHSFLKHRKKYDFKWP